LAAKRAALKVAEVNLDYTRIVAPTDGVVRERTHGAPRAIGERRHASHFRRRQLALGRANYK
jgi:multidrug efflux pump subunit AcrA (membrane-fusion protein)